MKRPKVEIRLVPRNTITAHNGRRCQYTSVALIRCMGYSPAVTTVDHDLSLAFPHRFLRLEWRSGAKPGLYAIFEIDNTTPEGRGAELSIRCGYFRRASFASYVDESVIELDDDGEIETITACTPSDISLTTQPAALGTHVNFVGEPPAWRKTMPKDPAARKTLERFLARCGVDPTPDPVYMPTSKAIVQASPEVSRPVQLHSRPWEVGAYLISAK